MRTTKSRAAAEAAPREGCEVQVIYAGMRETVSPVVSSGSMCTSSGPTQDGRLGCHKKILGLVFILQLFLSHFLIFMFYNIPNVITCI